MAAHGIRRLIFLSNFGVLQEKAIDVRGAALLLLARWVLRHTLADHRRALDVIRQTVPEWIAVRPMALTNGAATRQYRITEEGIPARGSPLPEPTWPTSCCAKRRRPNI
jgi:hypothetical protein